MQAVPCCVHRGDARRHRRAEADQAVRALTQPTNTIEAGVGYVTDRLVQVRPVQRSVQQGPVRHLQLRLARRRRIRPCERQRRALAHLLGTDLGLDTRTVYGGVRTSRASSRSSSGFDELRSNYADTYQTPFHGVGSQLADPAQELGQAGRSAGERDRGQFPRALADDRAWRMRSSTAWSTPPTAAQQAIVNNIIANDVPDFQNVDLDTIRKTYSGGFSYNIDPQWRLLAQRQPDATRTGSSRSGCSACLRARSPPSFRT